VGAHVTAYRLLLRLFPRSFRDRFGNAMADVFADRLCAARARSGRAVVGLWIHTISDLFRHGLAERRLERTRTHKGSAPMLPSLVQDVSYALHGFRRRPGFTIVALLTLTLGIGANVSVFSAIRAVLMNELPYANPDELVAIHETSTRDARLTAPNGRQFQLIEEAGVFASVAAEGYSSATLTGAGDPAAVSVTPVTPRFFDLAGVRPIAGRVLRPEDFVGNSRNVVISEGLWRRQFGGDPDISGRTALLDLVPNTIVGVMPDNFDLGGSVWKPWADGAWVKSAHQLVVIGRLRPGVTEQQAQAQIGTLMAQGSPDIQGNQGSQANQPGVVDGTVGARVERISERRVADVRPGLYTLQTIAAFVLLIACANLANLFLSQATARQQEMVMRTALGASRRRLVRQWLTEAMVLASIGSICGVALAYLSLPALATLGSWALPRAKDLAVSGPELAAGVGLGFLTAVIFGVVPALIASRADLQAWLRGSASQTTAGRSTRMLRMGLLATEVSVAVVVLTGTGLLIRSFAHVVALPLGFEAHGVLTGQISLPAVQYKDPEQGRIFARRLVDRIAERPEVRTVSISNSLPFSSERSGLFALAGPDGAPGRPQGVAYRVVSTSYFDTFQTPVVRGRAFSSSDVAGGAVAVVNEEFERRVSPTASAIGRRVVQMNRGSSTGTAFTIVGVVGDVRHMMFLRPPSPAVYFPLEQATLTSAGEWYVAARAKDPAADLTAGLRESVHALDPNLPLLRIESLDVKLGRDLSQRRFYLVLLSIFGGVAFVLAGIGVYGVMAHMAGLRVRELGIRLALGATPTQLKGLVMRQGLAPLGVGAAGGLVVAWWTTGALSAKSLLVTQLYQVRARDPWSLATAVAGLLTVGALACWIPARRVTRIDPATILKSD
jgi:predicted permease